MTIRLRVLLALFVTTAVAGLATGAEPPASAAPATDFTLKRGQSLSSLCSGIRQSGVAVAIPDCVKQILFANRQWFDDRFGYVWKDPASVTLDSAVRLWAGIPYVLPAELAASEPLQALPAQQPEHAQAPAPITPGHFDPKGKPPSEFTKEVLRQSSKGLPFADTRDFDEQQKGFIAPMKDMKIMADAGHVAWDMERFQFLNQDREFDSVHPSLHRISKLNNNYGLYEVIPGIYQVRGLDLTDISFVRGKKGWIAIDPMTAAETARAALKLFQEHVGQGLPITAVIYSHSHVDHWGGVRGIVDEADVRAGKVEIIAPRDFMRHTISENVYSGNAMNRRTMFQYGLLLPASPYGYVGQGLGQGVPAGATGLIAPTRIIEKDIEEIEVDGVKMIFQNTPDTEAPSEMNTYFPELKALWMAENCTATLHNIYTLRGAPVRDALNWSKYMAQALYLYGFDAKVMFASHHWPRWGNDRVQEVLRGQRDLYANMNNQVLHLANQGVTINEIQNVYEPPKSIQDKWFNRGYHGSPQHNSRGVMQRFLGFWDANPATLIPLSPGDSAPLYVEMMGGSEKILARGRRALRRGGLFLCPGDPEQAGTGRAPEPARQGSACGRLRATRLPAGKPWPA